MLVNPLQILFQFFAGHECLITPEQDGRQRPMEYIVRRKYVAKWQIV